MLLALMNGVLATLERNVAPLMSVMTMCSGCTTRSIMMMASARISAEYLRPVWGSPRLAVLYTLANSILCTCRMSVYLHLSLTVKASARELVMTERSPDVTILQPYVLIQTRTWQLPPSWPYDL